MSARRAALVAASALACALATGCTAAYDGDGERFVGGTMTAAPVQAPDAVPVVVDSDLAPDDLAAITFLLRHPRVRVLAITVPTTGMVTCEGGVDLLADLFDAIGEEPVPVACGDTPRGKDGVAFPATWERLSLTSSGLERPLADGPSITPEKVPSVRLLARYARASEGLQLVALGPLTEVAALRRSHPTAYARIARITTMAGILETASHDADLDVGEWNAAADPAPFAEVLAGPVPVTVVPDDPVPAGAPGGLVAPVVCRLGQDPAFTSPAYWDLATAAVATLPAAVSESVTGGWQADVTSDRGRLHRTGDGHVTVVTGLDEHRLDQEYARVFGADPSRAAG